MTSTSLEKTEILVCGSATLKLEYVMQFLFSSFRIETKVAGISVLMLSSVEFFKDEALQGVSRSIKQV